MARDSLVPGNRNFTLYCAMRLITVLALQMEVVAVGWRVYEITRSAFALALIGLASFLPAAGLVLFAGHAADRFNRKTVLILSISVIALAAAGLFFLVLSGSREVGPIYALMVLAGIGKAFANPAGSALVPNLVEKDDFSRAVGWTSTIFQAATIAGPALGGVLYVFGGPVVFGSVTVLLVIGIVLIAMIHHDPAPTAVGSMDWGRLKAGLDYVRAKPVIYGAITMDMFAVLLGGVTALLPIFAADILHTGPEGLGLLRAAPAAGAFLMALVLIRFPLRSRAGHLLYLGVAIFGVATIVFGLSTSFYLSLFCLFTLGAADMVSVIVRTTLVQIDTPDDMRGRVSAVNSVFIGASNELGEFESGLVAGLVGATWAAVIGGVGTLVVVALWMRLFPELLARDRI